MSAGFRARLFCVETKKLENGGPLILVKCSLAEQTRNMVHIKCGASCRSTQFTRTAEPPPSKHRLRAEAFAAKAENLPRAPDTPARSPSVRVASIASFSSSQRSEATSMDSVDLPPRAAGLPRVSIVAAARRARASHVRSWQHDGGI